MGRCCFFFRVSEKTMLQRDSPRPPINFLFEIILLRWCCVGEATRSKSRTLKSKSRIIRANSRAFIFNRCINVNSDRSKKPTISSSSSSSSQRKIIPRCWLLVLQARREARRSTGWRSISRIALEDDCRFVNCTDLQRLPRIWGIP